MVDIRQTIQYANYLSKNGWKVERVAEINYFIKKIPLIGSVIKIQRPEEIRYKEIKRLGKKHRAFQVIVEPKTELDVKYLESVGFKLSKSPYLPTKTLHLDLTKSKEVLFSGLKKDARYAIRKTLNDKHISYHISYITDVKKFREAWKKSIGLKRYVPPLSHLVALKKSFKKNCALYHYTSTVVQNVSAGGIFLVGDKIGYYWQAFSNKEARKLQAQYEVVWEGILWAKSRGAKIFDFEGVYDERFPNKAWLGFTHFKKSFGGYEVEYPGVFTKKSFPL